ncbi:MAG: host-nuclease inhibitor Gam family protein [Pontixanthobacter sp.]
MGVKTAIREPRSVEAATALCERFTVLESDLEVIDAARQADIAAINARADTAANDLIAERDAIVAKLAPWWDKSGKDLLKGKAKSLELGGALLGSRTKRKVLAHDASPKALVEAMEGQRWAKPYLSTTTALDKPALLKALDGKHGDKLAELGFTAGGGEETFFAKRAEQGQTRA